MPRERLIRLGAKVLTNYELLAILLRTGTKEMDVITLAKELLNKFSLVELKNISVEELMMTLGIKTAKATTIIASLELGSRLFNTDKTLVKIEETNDVYNLVKQELKDLNQEHLLVIYLNTNKEVIKKEVKYIGTFNQIILQPREIMSEAFKYNAPAIIMVHNHPSGNSTPSDADHIATQKMFEIANIVGIQIFDHVIIGKNEYYSIKQGRKYYSKWYNLSIKYLRR